MTTRGSRGRLVRRAAPRAFLVAVALGASVALVGCTQAAPPAPPDTYGGLPSFLPKDSITSDSVLTGSVGRPALTTEGDAVTVELPAGGTVSATVVGPVVPGEGLPVQHETTTCTWTITLSGATRDVPLRTTEMTTLDQLGNVYRLAPVAGRPAPPAVLHRGATATFELRTVMKVGEGVFRWAPGGRSVVAQWDFVVEND
ncbi:hypothetical protein [Frondihabitans sp. 762G35]|uniref:hypothetical protein n=1 Tax=Frondihabitans sp. 762G35 TaxID=1446794 RepID=UPI000F4DBE2A|nr:hypothetical protein [Frondihabitans sp. 762G35]